MKRGNKFKFLICMTFFVFISCQRNSPQSTHDPAEIHEVHSKEDREIVAYTCSMHRFIRQDKPGRCPICGMELVPIYKDEMTNLDTVEVMPRELKRSIEVMGRVAYDPELYLAQNNYLVARRNAGGALASLQSGLIKAAYARLELLGMSGDQIRALEKRGRPQGGLLVPRKGEEVLIYGAVFESDLPFLKPGQAVEVQIPGTGKNITAWISSIDPTISSMTRTGQIRVFLKGAEEDLRPDLFLKLVIHADLGSALTVPVDAVLETGERALAYVARAEGGFDSREITLGRRGDGYVEILSGLEAGEKVAARGIFLVDSESSLRGVGTEGAHHHH